MQGISGMSARWFIFLLLVGFRLGLAQQPQPSQHINVQVSDPSARPVVGLEITTQSPGSTAKTDNAGKARIEFLPTTSAIKLVIVSPKGLDFISPWDRTITLPPDFWSITVVPHGQREMLENPKVLSALTATIVQLQARTTLLSRPPSPETRDRAISVVGEELGLNSKDLENSINGWGATATDAYSQGLFSMFNFSYENAAELFADTLASLKDSTSAEDVQTATNAAFLLAVSSFENGDYRESVDAYAVASRFRPADPTIVSSSQLSAQMLERSDADNDWKEAQSPLGSFSREDFWGRMRRSSESDELTRNFTESIKDVDQRSQQGIKLASDKAAEADQHAVDDGNKESTAQQNAQASNTRIETVESLVANIDQYKPSKDIEVTFKTRDTVLSDSAKQVLDEIAKQLKGQRGYIIEVQGFSSGKGQSTFLNSQKMAESVVRYLVLNHDIPVYRIYLVGMGNAPTSSADESMKGSHRGGRVEVTILRNDLEQMSHP